MSKETPVPWDFTADPGSDGYIIYSTKGMEPTVAIVPKLEDARYIVDLANHKHDEDGG